jgi:hypothetical protein
VYDSNSKSNDLPLAAALKYAERGWFVFPVPPNTKMSYKSEGNHGTKWGMTKDAEQIKRDFEQWPDAGVGIPTGAVNKIFVFEIDTKEGHGVDGAESLRKLEEDKGQLPQTLMAVSPSGSIHYYFNHPGGEIKIKNVSNVLPGIDVRGDGGMVVAPPTIRKDGQYRWLNDHAIADAQQWLLDLVLDTRRRSSGDGSSSRTSDDGPQPTFDVNRTTIKAINEAAMGNFAKWVRELFPAAIEGNGGYRITSAALGRNLEEDISITPEGIVDFGVADMGDPRRGKRTPAELVQAWKHNDLGQAAEWLRQRLGIEVGGDSGVLPLAYRHGVSNTNHSMQWTIKNLLPRIGVGLLSGQWGAGKTYVALDLAGSVIVIPEDFFIDYRIKRHGGVLFIAAEGVSSIGLRFEAMLAKKLGHPMDDHSPPQPFAWINFQPMLLKLGAADLIAIARREAKWMLETHNVDLALIIVDTVAAAAAFDREDDAAQAQSVMGALGMLSSALDAFVLGVDHFGKNENAGTRGSSAKEAYAETVLALMGKRAVTGKITDLKMGIRKVRDGDSGREIPFRLEVIDCGVDEDGDQITTCVVRWEPNRQQTQASPQEHWRSGNGMVALRRALTDAVRDDGRDFNPRDYVTPVRAAPMRLLRERFKLAYPPPADDDPRRRQETVKKAFARAIETARTNSLIGTEEHDADVLVWEVPDNEPM